MNFENKQDEKIVEEVMNLLNVRYECHKYFNDGACSKVILLNNKYLIKQNDAIEVEELFYKYNKIDMFQKLIYVEPSYRYIVYGFVEGETMGEVDNPQDVITKVVKIANSYADYDKEGFGYYEEKVNTWEEFLESEIQASSKNVKEYIKDNKEVFDCINILKKYDFKKKVLHGDFGTHNFIKKDKKFVGVIDPQTVIGDKLYDILFAIVSNVDILNSVTLEKLEVIINEEKEKIYSMLMIVLYSRISRCLKYHREDIDAYMNYWNYLKIKKEEYVNA